MKISIGIAADKFNITYPALLAAVNLGRVKFEKCNNKFYVEEEDVKYYLENRYDRRFRKYNGEIIHDADNLSPHTASLLIGCNIHHVYYIMYHDALPYTRKGRWFIIKKSDALKYRENNIDILSKKYKSRCRQISKK